MTSSGLGNPDQPYARLRDDNDTNRSLTNGENARGGLPDTDQQTGGDLAECDQAKGRLSNREHADGFLADSDDPACHGNLTGLR